MPEEVPIKKVKLEIDECQSAGGIQPENTVIEATQGTSLEKPESSSSKNNAKNTKCEKVDTKKPIEAIRNNNSANRSVSKKRLQLLDKLLARSIQHERNLICQCVKHIVDNNFFDDQ